VRVFRLQVCVRLSDIDAAVRSDAVGCAALLLYHYSTESHTKVGCRATIGMVSLDAVCEGAMLVQLRMS